MGVRTRKVKQTPVRISYQDYRNQGAPPAGCVDPIAEAVGVLTARGRRLNGTAPAALLEEVLASDDELSVHGMWHHVLVGEVLLVALRNAGYVVSDELIDEILDRGEQLPRGSCGFLGTCGALVSAISVHAMLTGATPVAAEARARTLGFAATLAARLAKLGGNRCCKKSSYTALQLARDEFATMGFELPAENFEGRCRSSAGNETCDGPDCPFHPGGAQ
jgi:hypothetical protein